MTTFNDSIIRMEPLRVSVRLYSSLTGEPHWFDEVNEQLIKAELKIEVVPGLWARSGRREYLIRTDTDSPNLSGWQIRQVSAIFANLLRDQRISSFSLACASSMEVKQPVIGTHIPCVDGGPLV